MDCTYAHTITARLLRTALSLLAVLPAAAALAAAPGIGGPAFALVASEGHISQPDGSTVYSWGYGCASDFSPAFLPAGIAPANGGCPTMQLPGPTLIVTQGDTVAVTLANNLPGAAGNTSMLFPDFVVSAAPAVGSSGNCVTAPQGLLTVEAAHGCAVTYTFTATTPGTHVYYSGTQGDLQVEMGMYGVVIVKPATIPANCTANEGGGIGTLNDQAKAANSESDFRHAAAAYNNAGACYDREYLFQFSEIDPGIHRAVEEQVLADKQKLPASQCAQSNGCLVVETEPYRPAYFMINGRSMPDLMDPNYAVQYPNQPYNGNPHMHPGERVLLRVVGTGRAQHPFHEHGEHVRVLGRDGNLLVSATDASKLAGPLLFTTTTTPGQALDGIFYWTGKGLNWDVYGHGYAGDSAPCIPDANGFYTLKAGGVSAAAEPNFYEWCGDHRKPLETKPFGKVGSGGPVTLPDANLLAAGAWYSGSAYLGPDANLRSVGTTPISPSGTIANDPGGEAGFAFMWHSHAEREITTNNIFPGGMMMMMLVDPRAFVIDEAK